MKYCTPLLNLPTFRALQSTAQEHGFQWSTGWPAAEKAIKQASGEAHLLIHQDTKTLGFMRKGSNLKGYYPVERVNELERIFSTSEVVRISDNHVLERIDGRYKLKINSVEVVSLQADHALALAKTILEWEESLTSNNPVNQ